MNEPAPIPPKPGTNWPVALLTALLAAQLGLAWVQGRLLNRQHAQLLDIREDLQDLAEAIDASNADAAPEEGSLAPAADPDRPRKRHRRRPRRPRLAGYRIQEKAEGQEQPEQDPAAKELEAVRQSQEKAVKEAKVAQKKLSVREAAERAGRVEKIDNASRGFMWATIGTVVVLFAAYAARGFIRNRQG